MSLSIPPTGIGDSSASGNLQQGRGGNVDGNSSGGEAHGVGKPTQTGSAQASPVTPNDSIVQEDPTDIVDAGIYSGTNMYYSEVIDRRSHEHVRFIPPEAILELFARIRQDSGLKVDSTA